MNVLYLSFLNGMPWGGPTYSVPKQIAAQSKIDNVLWYNQIYGSQSEWKDCIIEWKKEQYYCDFDDYPSAKIALLPEPFNKPDLIVVEQCYPFAKKRIVFDLLFGNYKYILIPRGELTREAQSIKSHKKKIANMVMYNRLIKNSIAIQYLTDEERKSSSQLWEKRCFVVPNGTEIPTECRTSFTENGIKCVSIGRIAPFHKGFDLLIEACKEIKDRLIETNCTINIYGPDQEGQLESIRKSISDYDLSTVLAFHDGVYGDEKTGILLESDVFVMTSRFEGHPTALLGAMSYGLPCLVTTGSNMRNEIENNKAGWGADCSVESIKDAILTMINDKTLFALYGFNSRNLAEEYAWNRLAEKSHAEYEKLINI